MALNIQILIKDGEKILTQAVHEITTSAAYQEFVNKTLPGIEEAISQEIKHLEQVAADEIAKLGNLEKGK